MRLLHKLKFLHGQMSSPTIHQIASAVHLELPRVYHEEADCITPQIQSVGKVLTAVRVIWLNSRGKIAVAHCIYELEGVDLLLFKHLFVLRRMLF